MGRCPAIDSARKAIGFQNPRSAFVGYTMSMKPNESESESDNQHQPESPPDGRGERPTDPNELAKWIVDQTTDEDKISQPEQ